MQNISNYYIEALLSKEVYRNLSIVDYKDGDIINAPDSIINHPTDSNIEYRVIDLEINHYTGYAGFAFQKFEKGESGIMEATNEIIIAHRGTDDDNNADGLNNDYDYQANHWIASELNIGVDINVSGNISQLNDALDLYSRVLNGNVNADISQTGHSLGGALAKMVALAYGPGLKTTVFSDPEIKHLVNNLTNPNAFTLIQLGEKYINLFKNKNNDEYLNSLDITRFSDTRDIIANILTPSTEANRLGELNQEDIFALYIDNENSNLEKKQVRFNL